MGQDIKMGLEYANQGIKEITFLPSKITLFLKIVQRELIHVDLES